MGAVRLKITQSPRLGAAADLMAVRTPFTTIRDRQSARLGRPTVGHDTPETVDLIEHISAEAPGARLAFASIMNWHPSSIFEPG